MVHIMDNQAVTNAQSNLPAAIQQSSDYPFEIEVDANKTIIKGFLILILGFGIFLIWAAYAPLDEGVPTEGQVSIETKNKVIQHFSGGIVEKVSVKEGQFVKVGQVLLTIDSALAKAKFEEIRQHYLGLRSSENRLVTEQRGENQIDFHQDLTSASKDPNVEAKMEDQKQLLITRQRLLQADVGQISHAIRAEQAAINGYQQLMQHKNSELQLVSQQLSDINSAVAEGYVSRAQQTELQQKAAQLNGDIAQIKGNMMKSRSMISELSSKITARKQAEQKDIEEELTKVRLDVDAEAEKFKALKDELLRTEIKAPSDGQVIGLQVQTSGAIIQPGQKLMNIVPVGEKLLLDAKIPPYLIDRIQVNQVADVRFSSFAHSPQLLVEGKVVSVSSDIISDPSSRVAQLRYYYLARVEVTDKGAKTLGKHKLKPGMPVQIVIKTGERTFLIYLLHPFIKHISTSLKEE